MKPCGLFQTGAGGGRGSVTVIDGVGGGTGGGAGTAGRTTGVTVTGSRTTFGGALSSSGVKEGAMARSQSAAL